MIGKNNKRDSEPNMIWPPKVRKKLSGFIMSERGKIKIMHTIWNISVSMEHVFTWKIKSVTSFLRLQAYLQKIMGLLFAAPDRSL